MGRVHENERGEPDGAAASSDEAHEAMRLSRRAAMQIAAGGAVTAGFVLAPSVAGASVPEYASSASGDDGTETAIVDPTLSQAAAGGPLCLIRCCVQCWNVAGVSTVCARTACTCGTQKSCGNPATDALAGTLAVEKLSPSGSSIDLLYSIWGPTDVAGCTTQTPTLTMAIAGIDPPFQSCDVTVTVACTTGTPSGGGTFTDIQADGPVGPFAPQCTGSLIGGPPNEARCPAEASVTIELTCTFS